MVSPLLVTKALVSPLPSTTLSRPRLLELLQAGLQPPKRLILVTAPAGYGKTTLLADWVHGLLNQDNMTREQQAQSFPMFIAWLALSLSENDLVLFLSYLLQALKEALPADQFRFCQTIVGAMRVSHMIDPHGLLITLLNAIQKFSKRVLLILDDYQAIRDHAVHDTIRFLLQNIPANMHLAIASRSDPPLNLAQLRVRDQLCEIRMADLAFTLPETAEFFNRRHGLPLNEEEASILGCYTEGWAAGLHLAALAMKSPAFPQPADRSAFLQTIQGSHRHIIAYLTEEVFNQQPEMIQRFLLYTSVLDRFCVSLCDAVLPQEGQAQSLPASYPAQACLDWLENHQLFLIPEDVEHGWFHYHALFSDLLKGKLKQSYPGMVEEILHKAALWYEVQGLVPESFNLAIKANNSAFTADLFERHILDFFFQSEFLLISQCVSALPFDQVCNHPLLCAVNAASLALLPPYPPQSIRAAEVWLRAAEQALTDSQSSNLPRYFILMIRSYWARFLHEPHQNVIDLSRRALADMPTVTTNADRIQWTYLESGLKTNLALTYLEMGDEEHARPALLDARRASHACGDLFNESTVINCLIQIDRLHGELVKAANLCREALKTYASQQSLGRRTPFSGEIGIQLAEILIEQNRLDEAERQIKEDMALARWTLGHNILLRGHLAMARITMAKSDIPVDGAAAALRELDEAEVLSESGAALAGVQRVRVWLSLAEIDQQYLEKAKQWASRNLNFENPGTVIFLSTGGTGHIAWVRRLTVARVLIAVGDRSQIMKLLRWLSQQQQVLQGCGWVDREIELRIVMSLALCQVGDRQAALASIKRAVELAQFGNYMQVFLEGGQRVREQLIELQSRQKRVNPHLAEILAGFSGPLSREEKHPITTDELLEPLTAREIEVIALLCQGLSNQEIAEKLVVTLNTVKKHNYSIFQKLGVSNRAQAVLKAQALSLDGKL